MIHVTLIRPALVTSAASYSSPITPPIGLAYLAGALMHQHIEVTAIDAIGERPDEIVIEDGYLYQGLKLEETVARISERTSLIGVSCMFTQDWPYTRRLIQAIRCRFPLVPVVAGGEHITALPEMSLQNCPELDYCALGEGEETIAEMALRLRQGQGFEGVAGLVYRMNGGVVKTPSRLRIREVDEIPLPVWEIFPMETYLSSRNGHGVFLGRSMPILSTRGCPYECTFCSNPVMYGRLWIARKPNLVLDEIEDYIRRYHVDNVDFYDLTMVVKRDWIIEFCREIERRQLKFTWQLPSGTRSEVIDDEVAEALYRTGCRNMTYAPESGSEETLRLIKKKVQLPRLLLSTRSALRHGMKVKCNIIIGFPHETRRHILQSLWFSWKLALLGVHDVPFYLFSPYPGTELFEEMRAEHYPNGLDEKYFRSLVAYMDISQSSNFCRHVGPSELNFWRLVGMSTFYGLSFAVRPWRLIELIGCLFRNQGQTVLEQRLSALIHRAVKSLIFSTTKSIISSRKPG